MLNTLGVRSAAGDANRRKLSFRNVSNVVLQLLHTIKYSVPAPFSHLATTGSGFSNEGSAGAGFQDSTKTRQVRSIIRI
jgi:adenylate cyclase 1